MRNHYPDKPKRVYFFGTCLIDMSYPEAGMAGIRLIRREGVGVIFPQAQSCCGQPAYNSGFPEEARAVARKQLRTFPADYPIVVPSGSCAGMMKVHYPHLFEGDPEYDAACRFSDRVFELTEFLVHVLKVRLEDRGEPVTVTWHSSCHALREMGVTEDSKRLIRQLKNVTLKELERENECCGFGGTFSVKQPEISAAMVADKVADVRGTGASRLIGGDCGCLMNITGAMGKKSVPVTGQHIAEFIWERTNG
ncbi:oxidoreductase [Desulfonema ishimotonii]|uniref:Oxidoreductase n=1 Tax=Desulfonema ishimotonii TaxID=45657 RepID=A0A401FW25_9BACT|nr:(Fe-S)-binding protein [Desulfonema ishimotonii]GBC61144.1 oxidoreductase [Desulfonema ishimotonii]